MNHDAGRLVERLAERVGAVSVLAYDAPDDPVMGEDLMSHIVRPRSGNVRLVSLGPKGTWRDRWSRRGRVATIVGSLSSDWDVLLLRLVNRRAHLVRDASRCPRNVALVGGSTLELRRGARTWNVGWLVDLVLAIWEESHQRALIAGADLTFVVGEDLWSRYSRNTDSVIVLRESGLREGDIYERSDRLNDAHANFVVVGQMRASKGVFDALRAFERIKRSLLPRAHLHLVGDGEATDDLRFLVDDLGLADAVTFHGWIGDQQALFDLYRRMDVLLCLSHVDFLPRVTWEAMGSSVLVIATEVGALSAAFTHEEELMFVPFADVSSVEKAVESLLHNGEIRRHILRRGVARAREATMERMVDGLLEKITERWPELADRAAHAEDDR